MKLHVANLSYDATEGMLHELFSGFGQVDEAMMIFDRNTGQPRGFGFVTMSNRRDALDAIDGLNHSIFCGRHIRVQEARPKPVVA